MANEKVRAIKSWRDNIISARRLMRTSVYKKYTPTQKGYVRKSIAQWHSNIKNANKLFPSSKKVHNPHRYGWHVSKSGKRYYKSQRRR